MSRNSCAGCVREFLPSPLCSMCDDGSRYEPAIKVITKPGDDNYESADKMVSHPPHYQSETGLEVIDVIEAFTFDLKGIEATDTGNVIKYICRWKGKNGLQDLEKAKWYLQHLINHVKKLEKENGNHE